MNRIQKLYKNEIVKKMKEQFGYTNVLQVPKVTKVTINVGIGSSISKPGQTDQIVKNLGIISGQKPVFNKAKKSIAGFKIREGEKIGLSVTLRGDKMYDFIDRLVTVVLPRIRDFRGAPSKAFDRQGNYTLGIKEHTIFPEIPYDSVEFIHGLQVCVSTTAKTPEEGKALLSSLGFPFSKEQ